MSDLNYVFVAYRPNGLDTVRGCEMGRSNSDFRYLVTDERDQVVAEWFDVMKSSYTYKIDREYADWEVYLSINGVDTDINTQYRGGWPDDVKDIYSLAEVNFLQWKEFVENKNKTDAQIKAEHAAKVIKEAELATLRALQEKYPEVEWPNHYKKK
jgi:hypothetical protein